MLPRISRLSNRLVLGILLALCVVYVITRTAGLDQSLWEDELYTLHFYLREGLSAIFDPSAHIANNHPLYNVVGTGIYAVFGASEVVLRAGSVVPATAATVAMAYWLWRRHGKIPMLVFVFMATFSPMHFEEFRQARGWGLALLAAAIVLISSLEMQRSDALSWHHAAWFVAGSLIGIWTIYPVVLAFLVHGLILIATRRERGKLAVVASVIALGSVLFYWPLRSALGDPADARSGPSAAARDGFVTVDNFVMEPMQRLLTPLFELMVIGAVATVIAVLLFAGGVFWLWRTGRRIELLHLLTPIVVVFGALALRETAIWDRYVSFLLFHVLVVAALGVSSTWELVRTQPARIGLASLYAVVGLAIALNFAPYAARVISIPRENFKGVTELVESIPELNAAFTHTPAFEFVHSLDGVFLQRLSPEEFVAKSCSQEGPAVFIDYPRRTPEIESKCLETRGILVNLPQNRNPPINVWLVP